MSGKRLCWEGLKINTSIIIHVLKKPFLTVDNMSIYDYGNYIVTKLLTTIVLQMLGEMPDSFNLCFITPSVFLALR